MRRRTRDARHRRSRSGAGSHPTKHLSAQRAVGLGVSSIRGDAAQLAVQPGTGAPACTLVSLVAPNHGGRPDCRATHSSASMSSAAGPPTLFTIKPMPSNRRRTVSASVSEFAPSHKAHRTWTRSSDMAPSSSVGSFNAALWSRAAPSWRTFARWLSLASAEDATQYAQPMRSPQNAQPLPLQRHPPCSPHARTWASTSPLRKSRAPSDATLWQHTPT